MTGVTGKGNYRDCWKFKTLDMKVNDMSMKVLLMKSTFDRHNILIMEI
jgi:hypothetical protein